MSALTAAERSSSRSSYNAAIKSGTNFSCGIPTLGNAVRIAARTSTSFSSCNRVLNAAPATSDGPIAANERALPTRSRGSGQSSDFTSGPTASAPIRPSDSTTSLRRSSSLCPRFSINAGIASFARAPIPPSALAAPRRRPVSSAFSAAMSAGRAASPMLASACAARRSICALSRARASREFLPSRHAINLGTASAASGPMAAIAPSAFPHTCLSESSSALINSGSAAFAPGPRRWS